MMTLEAFLEHVAKGGKLGTPDTMPLMNHMSDEARRITCEMNNKYHTQEELRDLLALLTGRAIDETVKLFPPIYTDFGKNITLGKGVFINACCQFQDQGGVTIGDGCLIGHDVVFATLNHDLCPERRGEITSAPIVLGKNVWVGSHATILPGVTIGDGAVVAAGAVVRHDVAPLTIVGGVPARKLKDIDLSKLTSE